MSEMNEVENQEIQAEPEVQVEENGCTGAAHADAENDNTEDDGSNDDIEAEEYEDE